MKNLSRTCFFYIKKIVISFFISLKFKMYYILLIIYYYHFTTTTTTIRIIQFFFNILLNKERTKIICLIKFKIRK